MFIPKWLIFLILATAIAYGGFLVGKRVVDRSISIDIDDSQLADASADNSGSKDGSPASDTDAGEEVPSGEAPEDTPPASPGGPPVAGGALPATDLSGEVSEPLPTASVRYISSFGLKSFSPREVTIKVGQTVRWTNETSGGMWIASDPHPLHTDLPELDKKSSVSPGQSWEFTFTNPGTYGYHNHLSPSKTGTVIVTE